MKHLQIIVFSLIIMSIFAGAAQAQHKSVKKASARSSTASKSVLPPLDVRAAREKVSNQLANVNRFVEVLGPIAQSIETLDDSGRSQSLPANEENKQKVITAIRNLKAGLTDLEADFRTKPNLQKYLSSIQGITELAAEAEDSAIAGRFVGAKEPLRNVAQKLTDTLKVLPASPEI
jgi:hypothetical protein